MATTQVHAMPSVMVAAQEETGKTILQDLLAHRLIEPAQQLP
jgi:hypothetical protein